MNQPATRSLQSAQALSDSFLGRVFEAARQDPQPTRLGGFAYIGTAEGAWSALRERGRFAKTYDLLETIARSRFSTDGPEWTMRRTMTQPLYAGAGRAKNADLVRAVFEERVASAEPSPYGVVRALTEASADIFFRAIGAESVGRPSGAPEMIAALRDLARGLQMAALYGATGAVVARLSAQAERLRAAAADLCAADPGLRDLCVRMAAEAERADGFEAPAEILFNFFAGVDTTLSTFTFALDRLGTMPDVQADLAREAVAGGDRPALGRFIDETLRFFPPIPFLTRKALIDGLYGGTEVRAGDDVLISILAVHRDPACWARPHAFDPGRREFADGTFDRRAFLPFSAGERICGGLSMARLELSEGLAAVLKRFAFERPAGPVRIDYALNMRAVWPDTMTLRPRNP